MSQNSAFPLPLSMSLSLIASVVLAACCGGAGGGAAGTEPATLSASLDNPSSALAFGAFTDQANGLAADAGVIGSDAQIATALRARTGIDAISTRATPAPSPVVIADDAILVAGTLPASNSTPAPAPAPTATSTAQAAPPTADRARGGRPPPPPAPVPPPPPAPVPPPASAPPPAPVPPPAPAPPPPAPAPAPAPAAQYDTRIGLGADANGVPLLTKSANAQYIYWNPAHPNAKDTNAGTDPAAPKLTLKWAWAALRDGYGDWLVMAQGATSTEGFSNLAKRNGLSAQYPIVVTTYDTSDPKNASKMRQGLVTLATNPTDSLLDLGDPGAANRTVFENIIFDKPATSSWGVGALGTVQKDLMFYNVRFFRTNVAFQGDYSGNPVATRLSNVVFRRCVFAYAYAPGSSHAQGLYLWTTDGVTVEDSIFYHNGWQGVDRNAVTADEGGHADIFKHGAYFGTLTNNTIFRRNVAAHNSSHGMQMRGGGVATDNVFTSNPVNASVGGGDHYDLFRPSGVPYTFVNNVAVGSENIDAGNPRGFGMQFMNTQSGGIASGNIVVNVSPKATVNVFALSAASYFPQPTYINWTNNIQWGWGKATLASFTQDPGYGGIAAQIFITRTANIIDSENAGGSNLTAPAAPFPDPNRSVATFAIAQGYASEDAFWTYAIQHPEVSWAKQIGDYIRAGFGR